MLSICLPFSLLTPCQIWQGVRREHGDLHFPAGSLPLRWCRILHHLRLLSDPVPNLAQGRSVETVPNLAPSQAPPYLCLPLGSFFHACDFASALRSRSILRDLKVRSDHVPNLAHGAFLHPKVAPTPCPSRSAVSASAVRQPRAQNANNDATGLKRSGAASPPSLVLFLLSPEYLPRPRLIFGFIGVRRTQLTSDTVR